MIISIKLNVILTSFSYFVSINLTPEEAHKELRTDASNSK